MIEFDPETHTYTFEGQKVPSVTEVLQDVGIVDYSGVPSGARQSAMSRGVAVHLATEYDDRDDLDEESVMPEVLPFLNAWRDFRRDTGFTPEKIEERVFHEKLFYAGTFDRMGKVGKRKILLDIKTGSIQRWTGYQLAAYALAYGDKKIHRWGVELSKNGRYKLKKFDDKHDFAVWESAMCVFNRER